MRALDWSRTSDTRRRRTVLYPLSYKGEVRVPGLEPGMPEGDSFTGCGTIRRPRRAWGDWPGSNRRTPGSRPGATAYCATATMICCVPGDGLEPPTYGVWNRRSAN